MEAKLIGVMKMKGFKCIKLRNCREKHDSAVTGCTEQLSICPGENKAFPSVTSLVK